MSDLPLTFLYPSSAAEDVDSISYAAQCAKISRHSQCSSCDQCKGMHPPEGWVAITDDSEDAAAVLSRAQGEDGGDWMSEEGYLKMCACGHELMDHGVANEMDGEDFQRRLKYAAQMDEHLEAEGKLLDFGYVDEELSAFRQQMEHSSEASEERSVSPSVQPSSPREASSPPYASSPRSASPSSSLSDVDIPPLPATKRRRISASSSLSSKSNSNSDEEEDKPLAARLPEHTPRRQGTAGKKSSLGHSHPTVSSKVPRETHAGVGAEVLSSPVKLKNEEPVKVDAGQLARLVTGVTVDAGLASTEPTIRREKPAILEERKGIIRFVLVRNDGSPTSSLLLTGLKTLFQRQLPMMPKEYVTRLVFDRNSEALAVVMRGWKVVGGITYRPFPHRTFAEIVFFAVTGVYQVSGYGSLLMNKFKMHMRTSMPTILHFLTYADNSAIGYFKKQGFSKEITLDRSLWVGYIKDYDGGTIMQCSMLPKVDYLHVQDILSQQKETILNKIRRFSKSHTIVHPGPAVFKDRSILPEGFTVDPKDVPGLSESGWNPEMDAIFRRPTRGPHHNLMARLLTDLQQHPQAWAFQTPVNTNDVPEYLDAIKKPMDFSTMEHKLESNMYAAMDDFVADANLVFSNCKLFNPEGSVYHKNAKQMERFLKDWLADRKRE